MRISSPPPLRRLMACAGVLLCLALGGCVPAQEGKPEVRHTPTSAPAASAERPVFASDEEALAAAEASYARYLDVTNSIANAGGAGAERLEEVTVGEALNSLTGFFEELRSIAHRSTGSVQYDGASLRGWIVDDEGRARVEVSLCTDVGGTTVVNSTGADVTPSGRQPRQLLGVTFVSREGGDEALVVSRSIVDLDAEGC